MRARRIASFWLAVGLGLAGAVTPQGEPEAEAPQDQAGASPELSLGETVDVRVVNVDVYVTDRQGNPVTGLGPKDFRLFDDGKTVQIVNFYAVTGGRPIRTEPPTPTAEEQRPAEQPETTPEEATSPAPPEDPATEPQAPPLQLVIYIDNANIAPENRNRVFRRLREFVYETVDRDDRVMLISYDRSLHVRQSFTGNRHAIGRGLIELETAAGQGSSIASKRQELFRQIEEADTSGQVSGRVRQFAREVQNDLRFTLDALRESVGSLAGLPGRKILLYVSDGLPLSPARDLFYALQYRFDEPTAMANANQFNQGRAFAELTQLANADRVAFYTVDAKGLELPAGFAAEYRGGSYESDWRTQVAELEQSNLQDSIRLMAARTGGLAIVNTNDIGKGLARMAQDLDTYYSLGFRPSRADDRFHPIKVEVLRKGVTVRHREGYRDKSIVTRMSEGVEANLRFGAGDNPMNLRIDLGEPSPRVEGDFVVPVSVKIPLDRLTLIPRDDLWVGRALVFFGTMSEKGELSGVSTGEVDVRIPSADYETAQGQLWSFDAQLLARAGRQRLAVGVWDQFGAQESLVNGVFDVAP